MKKLFLPLLILCVVCSCSKTTTVKPQTQNLEFNIECTIKKEKYTLLAHCDNNSNLTLTVKKPKTLENLKITFSDTTCKTEFLGLEKELPLDSLEKESVLRIFYEGFLKSKYTSELSFQDDEYFLEYRFSDNKYRFNFSQNGLPLSIKGIGNDINILIKGVKILN